MSDDKAKCQVCGAPATTWARDIIRIEKFETMDVERRTFGDLKRGCEKHPVESREFRATELTPFNLGGKE